VIICDNSSNKNNNRILVITIECQENWDIGDNNTGTIHNKYNDNDDNENKIL